MKQLVTLSMVLLSLSCNQAKEKQSKTPEEATQVVVEQMENFDWLLGKWKRMNEEEGKETFEHWTQINESKYLGVGYTLKEGDTIWQEKMELTKSQNHWDLAVISPEEAKQTIFKGTSHTATTFTCENPENEFPNIISYQKDGAHLEATVSGGEMSISFDFKNIEQ